MIMQHLHGLFTVCEMTMQHLHSPFTVCDSPYRYPVNFAGVRRSQIHIAFIPAGCIEGRICHIFAL